MTTGNALVFQGLRDLRERLVRLSLGTVAEQAHLEKEHLRDLEEGRTEPSVLDVERLAAVYSVDPDCLWDDPIRVDPQDAVSLLASLQEYAEVGDMTRVRILRAASAARDLVELRELLGEQPVLPPARAFNHQTPAFEQGAELAASVRRELGLGVDPIPSLRDLLRDRFPWVAVLHAELGAHREAPAGVSFADPHRGPAIVLNTQGRNQNPCVRRFSAAHELCHLLADWERSTPLASVSGFLLDRAFEREQRANGFAVRLLCPESIVQRLRSVREEDAARELMEDYGLHYSAARLYLANEAGARLPATPPPELMPFVMPSARWVEGEALTGNSDFPASSAPRERRGPVALAACRAYSAGKIGRDALARYLGLSDSPALEEILGYFDLSPPPEDDFQLYPKEPLAAG